MSRLVATKAVSSTVSSLSSREQTNPCWIISRPIKVQVVLSVKWLGMLSEMKLVPHWFALCRTAIWRHYLISDRRFLILCQFISSPYRMRYRWAWRVECWAAAAQVVSVDCYVHAGSESPETSSFSGERIWKRSSSRMPSLDSLCWPWAKLTVATPAQTSL